MAASEEIRSRTIQALSAAHEFAELYHETFDKRRQAIGKVYQDTAQMVWNGNAHTGNAEIVKFFNTLPASEHTVEGMDTQPVIAGVVGTDNNSSIVITFYGKVKFKDTVAKTFNQTIMLSVQDNKWKVVSDNYRFIE
ncbi:NTF2-related export protein 2 [Aplysia californica]|uniref:NTF2-related export protein n=1 Tax=Aplysia californica TaxID=6500 RepID=A0ABM0K9D1_APLCA|nr:NTF2-related export protein 2 [Aplysia californica]